MKKIYLLILLTAIMIPAAAGAKVVDSLIFDARGSFNQEIHEGTYTGTLTHHFDNFSKNI